MILGFLFSAVAGVLAAATRPRADETELVQRLLAGDEAAFRELVQRYQGPLLKLARSFVSSAALAEEVVQETWVAVLDGLPRFEGRASLKTWIFRILSNRARTRGVREARSRPFSSLGEGQEDDEPAVDPGRFTAKGTWAAPPGRWHERLASDRLEGAQTLQAIHAAIEALPENQRAVVELRDVEGLEAAEVCELLELSEANQRVLLHRGRAKVRAALEAYLEGEV